jgi:hypothetical protein
MGLSITVYLKKIGICGKKVVKNSGLKKLEISLLFDLFSDFYSPNSDENHE